MAIKSSTTFSLDRSVAILCVGEPKVGKSRLMFAFPGLFVLDCDMNLAAPRRAAPDKSFFFDQPLIDDKGQKRETAKVWTQCVASIKEAIADPKIRTIAIDGLGIMCEYIIAHVLDANIKAGTCKTGKMELQMWGEVGRILRDTIMLLRASGKIIFVTSHQTSDKDEATGVVRYFLAIPGASKETLGGLFTDVWGMSATPGVGDKTKYEIRTKPTHKNVALGTSFPLQSTIDISNKSPSEVWTLLSPSLGLDASGAVLPSS